MYDVLLAQEYQRSQYLNGEPPDQIWGKTAVIVSYDELVKILA